MGTVGTHKAPSPPSKSIDIDSLNSGFSVDRRGIESRTLGFSSKRPQLSLNVQISWLEGTQDPPKATDVQESINS